jgi:hypothetical protein
LKSLSIVTKKINVNYNDKNGSFTIENRATDEVKTYKSDFNTDLKKNLDYAVISKIPGPAGNVIHLFISDHDIGCIESVKLFTDNHFLTELKNNYQKDDGEFFLSTYKAKGIKRTIISYKLEEYISLSDSVINTLWN